MLLIELRELFRHKLPSPEADNLFYLSLSALLDLPRSHLALYPAYEVAEEITKHFYIILERLEQEEPIQYILGKTSFFGLDICLSPEVLIPRPETEEMVDYITTVIPRDKTIKIIDLCTGSGCIAIALAKHYSKAVVYATDISSLALKVAKKNASNNKVDVHFIKHDILKETVLDDTFDIVISNPPYITLSERKQMSRRVLDYEPAIALFVSNDKPLLFYEAIGRWSTKHLKEEGMLFLEINEAYGDHIHKLLEGDAFSNINILKDFRDKDRVVFAIKI